MTTTATGERGRFYTPAEFAQFVAPAPPEPPNWEESDPDVLRLRAIADAARTVANDTSDAWLRVVLDLRERRPGDPKRAEILQLERDLLAEKDETESAAAIAIGAYHRAVQRHTADELTRQYAESLAEREREAAEKRAASDTARRSRLSRFFGKR